MCSSDDYVVCCVLVRHLAGPLYDCASEVSLSLKTQLLFTTKILFYQQALYDLCNRRHTHTHKPTLNEDDSQILWLEKLHQLIFFALFAKAVCTLFFCSLIVLFFARIAAHNHRCLCVCSCAMRVFALCVGLILPFIA